MPSKSDKIITVEEYPNNSHKAKEQTLKKQEKNIEKIVKGKVITKKKSIFDKIAEAFVGDDTKSVGEYLLYDIFIPAMKSTLLDMISGGSEKLLYGNPRPNKGNSRIYQDRGVSKISYSSYYENKNNYRKPFRRGHIDMDDVILGTRYEAEEVLDCLDALVAQYGAASISDLYELLGIESNYTDQKWGWDNLSTSSIRRVREGFLIDLPRPIVID